MKTNKETKHSAATVAQFAPRWAAMAIAAAITLIGFLGTSPQASAGSLRAGYYDLGDGYSMIIMKASDARAFASALKEPVRATLKAKSAQVLAKFLPTGALVTRFTTSLAQYTWKALAYEIEYQAKRHSTVTIYFWKGLPLWADPGL